MAASFKQEGNLIYLKIEGLVTLEDGKKMQDETQKFVETTDCDKVLIDITKMSHEYKFSEIMQIFGRIPEIFPKNVKHAIVFSKTTFDVAIAKFSEDFSFNRGINIRFFETVEDARSWLID